MVTGGVVGNLAERWTWQQPAMASTETELAETNTAARALAELDHPPAPPFDEMLANAARLVNTRDDRGAAGIVLLWISSATPEQLRGLLETADFPERLDRYRDSTRASALYRWAELDGETARAWAAEHGQECTPLAAWLPLLKRDREGALAKLRNEAMPEMLQAAMNYLAVTDEGFDLASIIARGADNLGAWAEIQMTRGISLQQIFAAMEHMPSLHADQKRSLLTVIVNGSDLTTSHGWREVIHSTSDPELRSLLIEQIATVANSCPEVVDPLSVLKLLVDGEGFTARNFGERSNEASGNLSLVLQAAATNPTAMAQWLAQLLPESRARIARGSGCAPPGRDVASAIPDHQRCGAGNAGCRARRPART